MAKLMSNSPISDGTRLIS